MKIYKVYIGAERENGTYNAITCEGDKHFNNVEFLFQNDNIKNSPLEGRAALLVEKDNQYFIVGYFDRSQYKDETIIKLLDGEMAIRAGEFRALMFSPTGTIGIYAISRKDNGELITIPKFVYNGNDNLNVSFEELTAAMYGASDGGNFIVRKDDAGNYEYIFKGKTNENDATPRFKFQIKNSNTGPIFEIELDSTPNKIQPNIKPTYKTLPNKVKISINSKGEIDISTFSGGITLNGNNIPQGSPQSMVLGNNLKEYLDTLVSFIDTMTMIDPLSGTTGVPSVPLKPRLDAKFSLPKKQILSKQNKNN